MKAKIKIPFVFLIWMLAACQTYNDTTVELSQNPTVPSEKLVTTTIIEESSESNAAATPSPIPLFEDTPCFFDLPENHSEGETLRCGFVIVPEDHRDPSGKMIKLATVVIKSLNKPGQPDPILLLSGGPGEKTVAYAPPLANRLASLNAERDLIIFDQPFCTLFCAHMDDPWYITLVHLVVSLSQKIV